ncbi:uncharacterized protein LODBEIA_P26320 [Lodderomyces beijingensis]|uniref:Alpha-1,3-mannosyltransferase n=1 Tax=Lodderomyces beijingensis TaxID=1775926 RepID=A0ABP0ZJS9_9ASCO
MRLSLRRKILLAAAVTSLLVGACLLHSKNTLQYFREIISDTEKFDPESLKAHSLQVKKDLHYSNYLYSGFDNFTNAFGGAKDVNSIKAAPLGEKCRVFFDQFNAARPDFKFQAHGKPGYRFDKSSDKKESFFRERILKLEENFAKENKQDRKKFELSRKDQKEISSEYERNVAISKEVMQEMADITTAMRIYGKCFIGRDLDEYQKSVYGVLSEKLFPFISRQFPIFKKPDSDPVSGWPIINEEDGTVVERKDDLGDENMIDFIFNHSKGKGIVISAASRHAKDVIRLIKLFRAMNNELPIQIIYKSDITKKNIKNIELAATADVESILDPQIMRDHMSFMPELELLKSYKDYGSRFPKQKIEFINISNCITRSYKYSFPGYSNKILAMLFSTFEEILLFDADTVPLVPPQEFFESSEYQKSGTFYFQDRSLRDPNDYIETNFFATLFPTNEYSIDTLFDIPRTTSKTLNNRYMTGWRHHQEAGVVAFNKRTHFMGLLMMCPFSLWSEPVQSSIWGDKELYWIGLAAAGDENYEFNPVHAASVGMKTTHRDRKYYPNSGSNELCSTHPGHVNKDGKLLWINSGFGYCKKNGYYRDRMHFPFITFEMSDLVQLYNHPLKIRAALVPPGLPNFREPGNPVDPEAEEKFRSSWRNRKKDTDEINENLPHGTERTEFIQEWGPQKGWVKNPICFGYYYCAYDRVQSYSLDREVDAGMLYEFDEKSVRFYDYLSKIWLTGGSRKALRSKEEVEESMRLAAQQG